MDCKRVGWYALILPIWECAAGQGMIFDLSVPYCVFTL